MPPRGQRRRITCAKQDRFEKQTTWRDWSASCLKGCIYHIYINIDVQNKLNGIVMKTLQCWAFVWECGTSWTSYMSDSCSLSPPSGLRIKMLGLPCNQRAVSYQQSQKSYTRTNASEKLTGLFSRNLMTPGPSSHENPGNEVEILLVCFSFYSIPKGDWK